MKYIAVVDRVEEEMASSIMEEALEEAKEWAAEGDYSSADPHTTIIVRLVQADNKDEWCASSEVIVGPDCQCHCECGEKADRRDDQGIPLCSECGEREVFFDRGDSDGYWCGREFDGETCPDCDGEIEWGMIQTKQAVTNTCAGRCGCADREWIKEDRGGWVISVRSLPYRIELMNFTEDGEFIADPDGYSKYSYFREDPEDVRFESEEAAHSWAAENYLGEDDYGIGVEWEVVVIED